MKLFDRIEPKKLFFFGNRPPSKRSCLAERAYVNSSKFKLVTFKLAAL